MALQNCHYNRPLLNGTLTPESVFLKSIRAFDWQSLKILKIKMIMLWKLKKKSMVYLVMHFFLISLSSSLWSIASGWTNPVTCQVDNWGLHTVYIHPHQPPLSKACVKGLLPLQGANRCKLSKMCDTWAVELKRIPFYRTN